MRPISLPARPRAPVFANAGPADVRAAVEVLTGTVETFRNQFDGRLATLENHIRDDNTRSALAALGDLSSGGMLSSNERAEREAFAQFGRGIRAAMSTDSNPDGGYLVPETVEQAIARIARDATPMRSLARVVTASSGTYVKTASLNGANVRWVGEKESRSQTNGMNLAELEFVVHEMQAMPAVTQKLIDDSRVDIATELSLEIATAFTEAENATFVIGDGVKKPRGFLAYDTVANASWAWGKLGYFKSGVAAALFDSSNNGVDALYSVYYGLKASYRANAVWMMNSQTALVVSQLKDDNENYLWQPSIQLGMPPTLLGRPVVIDENMPAIEAGEHPIAFGDFQRGYLIVDRLGIRVLRDPYSTKPYVLFYTTKRVGGGVQDFQAIKLLRIAA